MGGERSEGSQGQLERVGIPARGTLPQQRMAEYLAADQAQVAELFAEATNQRLRVDVAHGIRQADQLEVGEVVIEPHLGPARLAAVEDANGFVLLTWADDRGSSTAFGRYRANLQLHVRMPGPADLTYIQRSVDQAVWNQRNVPGKVARLIAAHLHPGHDSRVFRFAIDGSITGDCFYEELDEMYRHRMRFRPWVQALVRHCIARDEEGPVPGWLVERDLDELDIEVEAGPPSTEKPRPTRRAFLVSRYVAAATVRQLLDAAFDLGLKAAQSRSPTAALTKLARARVRSSQRRNVPGGRTIATAG